MRGGVQVFAIAAATFLLGLVVGGIGPRGEVADLQQEVFRLEREASRGGNAGRELAALITKGLENRAPGQDGITIAPVRPPDATDDGGPPPDQHVGTREIPGEDAPPPPVADEGPRTLEAARDALAVRRRQARAALLEDVDPTEDQEAEIDAAFDDMNVELEAIAREVVDIVNTQGEPSRRDMMRLGADTLDAMVVAEDRVLAVLDPGQRDAVRPEATDPASFVDPEIVDLLLDLDGGEP